MFTQLRQLEREFRARAHDLPPSDLFWRNLVNLKGELSEDYDVFRMDSMDKRMETARSRRELEQRIEKLIMGDLSSENPEDSPLTLVDRKAWENIGYYKERGMFLKDRYYLKRVKPLPLRYNRFRLVLSRIQDALRDNKFIYKRDVFYREIESFGTQEGLYDQCSADTIIDDIACFLEVPRIQLHVLASAKGLVYGRLELVLKSREVQRCDIASTGTLIPNDMSNVVSMHSNAAFVLIVEKDCVFSSMILNDRIPQRLNCILVTGKGIPDISTRHFVKMLYDQLRIPVLCLVDADPRGIEIMCIYRFGSRSMAYDCDNLACPQIRWLGVFPSEIYDHLIPQYCFKKLKDSDYDKLADLEDRPFMIDHPEILTQVTRLYRDLKVKIDITALYQDAEPSSSPEDDPGYLYHYLVKKIREGDFI